MIKDDQAQGLQIVALFVGIIYKSSYLHPINDQKIKVSITDILKDRFVKNLPNFKVEIDGVVGEIFVSDNDGGRFMCVFVSNSVADFTSIYNAYGFMVWTTAATHTVTEYFPIKLTEQTRLSKEIMCKMWERISTQIELI